MFSQYGTVSHRLTHAGLLVERGSGLLERLLSAFLIKHSYQQSVGINGGKCQIPVCGGMSPLTLSGVEGVGAARKLGHFEDSRATARSNRRRLARDSEIKSC
jgi:hypothetical protein